MDALRLGNEAEKLHLRVETTNSIARKHEARVEKDVNATNEVNHQVGQARTRVSLAGQQVDKALAEVDEIIKDLAALPEIGES